MSGDTIALGFVESAGAAGTKFRICRGRADNFPSLLNAGDIKDIPAGADDLILDVAHGVLFRSGVVGVEYNHEGARPRLLQTYLRSRFPNAAEFVLLPLAMGSIREAVSNASRVTALEFRINRGEEPCAAELESGADKLAVSYQGDSCYSVAVRVAVKPKSNQSIPLGIVRRAMELINMPGKKVSRMAVNAALRDGDSVQPFNLVEHQVKFDRQIERHGRTKRVRTEAAHRAIQEVYLENRELIERAFSVEVAGNEA